MDSSKSNAETGNASRIFKSFAQTLKKTEKHLLLSTTYGLNASFTKKIAVGLGLRDNSDEFEPVVRLCGNTSESVSLNVREWNILSDFLDVISDYFGISVYADAQWWLDEIELGACKVRFTVTHGARAIRFDLPEADNVSTPGQEIEGGRPERKEEEEEEPRCKRPKLYIPSIVMQKTTFDGLKAIYVCIDERIRRLQGIAASVNECRKLYIEYIASRAARQGSREPSLKTITQVARNDYEIAREIIRPKLDSDFGTHYFDIALLELSTLFPQHIAVEVRLYIENKRQQPQQHPAVEGKPETPANPIEQKPETSANTTEGIPETPAN